MRGAYYALGDATEQDAAEAGTAMRADDDEISRPAPRFVDDHTGNARATRIKQYFLGFDPETLSH